MSYRILQVIDKLSTGGAERVLVDLSNLIFKAGIYVEVLTLVSPGELHQFLSPDIPFHCIGRKKKFSLKSMYKVHVHCKNFDVIHVHLRYNFRYISLVKLLFFGKYKILDHDHFGDIEKETSIPFGLAFFSKLQWDVLPELELVEADSAAVRDLVVRYREEVERLDADVKKALRGFPALVETFKKDVYRYNVRDKIIELPLFTESLSKTACPR